MKISTKCAIELLQQSDRVILEGNDILTVATFVGYAEEGDPNSPFVLGAEGWDAIIVDDAEWDPKTAVMTLPGFAGTISLYRKVSYAADGTRTNRDRASRAKTALQAYASVCGETVGADTVTDLFTDLHHYLRVEGFDEPGEEIDSCMLSALNHFEAEVAEEKEPS